MTFPVVNHHSLKLCNCNNTMDGDEHILRVEAEEAVKEIAFAVKEVELSKSLPCSDETVHLNVLTKENEALCIKLTVKGFQVVGRKYDDAGNEESQYFETIYSLLDNFSPEYRRSFGEALMTKLSQLQNQDEEDDDGAT